MASKKIKKDEKKISVKGSEEQRKHHRFRSKKSQRRYRQHMKAKGKKTYLSWNVRAKNIEQDLKNKQD